MLKLLSLASIRNEWPWWDDLHAFWRQLPNYNTVSMQSSEPGTQHALEAEALFAPVDEDDDMDHDGEAGYQSCLDNKERGDQGDEGDLSFDVGFFYLSHT